jgi:tetratricopeptide (TPR) repeat protein
MEPAESRHHARLGGVLRLLNLLDTAEQVLRKALAMPPGPAARSHARHHLELGLVLEARRRHREAGAAYRKALELDPADSVAYKLLAAQAKDTGFAVDRGAAEQRLRDAALSVQERGHLHFGLAYACEALADYAGALHHLREANRLRASVRPYDPAEYANLVEKLTRAFDAELLARPAPAGQGDKPPIFVVGLPRAGKTLLASALGRHSQVTSADESPEFANAVDRVFGARGGPAYPGDVAEVDATLLARVGIEFTEHESRKFDHPGRVASTDLQLDCYLGMLHLCLPGAKIIHVSRGLRDNCVEIYRKDFNTEYHGYSHDLAATVERYRLHHGLMAHWKTLLPGAIHTLAFEDLVRDPEAELRKVAAFCGLPWEPACGAWFEGDAGAGPTPENAVGTWRRYAAQLGPLFDELGAE